MADSLGGGFFEEMGICPISYIDSSFFADD